MQLPFVQNDPGIRWSGWVNHKLHTDTQGDLPRAFRSRKGMVRIHDFTTLTPAQRRLKGSNSKKDLCTSSAKNWENTIQLFFCHRLPNPFHKLSNNEKACSKEVPNNAGQSQALFPRFNNPGRTRNWNLFLHNVSPYHTSPHIIYLPSQVNLVSPAS